MGFSRPDTQRSAEVTPTALRTATSAATAQRSAGQPAAAPVAVPTAVRAQATPAPTRGPGTATAASKPSNAITASTPGTPGRPGTHGAEASSPTSVAVHTPTVAANGPPVAANGRPVTQTAAAVGAAGAVALTFDAGADRGYAQDILDLLQTEHVVASFGITGEWARANPDLVRRMAADGHMVFNHTLDHRSFTGVSDARGGLSAARRRAELEDADAIITPLLGHSTQPWYRLPYGDDDAQVAADVRAAGYTRKVGWTVDSLGWRGSQATDIVARCLSLAGPGAVYVFHVGHASQDAIALPQVIQGLRDRGFSFRRIDQT